jgi:hypothetical protein
MRLQHLKQIANALATDDPSRVAAKAVIVTDVERLHWRIWNGKATNAGKSIDRIRTVMHHFQGEPGSRKSIAPSRKSWIALRALDDYLTGQSLAGQLRGTASCRIAGWHRDHRRDSQFPGEPPDEQIPTNALVATWCRPAASGSLRHLQWYIRFCLRTKIPTRERYIFADGDRRLTSNLEPVPQSTQPPRCNTVTGPTGI